MKKLIMKMFRLRYLMIAVICIVMAGCGYSNEQISQNVKSEIQRSLNNSPQYKDYCMVVSDVQIVSERHNVYSGIVTVLHENTSHDIKVKITVDGDRFLWELPPMSFMFLAQKELRKMFRR